MAVVRPDSWDFPLLLHVLGAMLLVGSLLFVTVTLIGAWRVYSKKCPWVRSAGCSHHTRPPTEGSRPGSHHGRLAFQAAH